MLAFIYVPLNLATSIFGMNIQQLNQSGKSLRVFLATASVALLVTGSAWYLIEQVKSYTIWREDRLRHQRRKQTRQRINRPQPTKFSLMIRLNMLIWLLLSSYRFWIIRRGLWWRLLTNSSSRLCSTQEWNSCYRRYKTAAEIARYSSFEEPWGGDYLQYLKDTKEWVWRSPSSQKMMEEDNDYHL